MANPGLNEMKSILSNLDSQATSKPQPSKTLNSGTAKIDGANPTSPSTNNATRREEYASYIKTLNKDQQQSLYQEVLGYKNQGLSNDEIYDKVLNNKQTNTTPKLKTANTGGVDLTIKGNFDVYNPVDWESQPELMQQYYVQANNDIKASKRALSQLMLQQESIESKSSNVNQVSTLIDAIENAYDRGVFDAETIASTLGVDVNTVKLIQQGKANELVKLDQEYVQDQLKSFYRAEEDYDTNLARTMEDYQLAKTNLDNQYNSAMQTLKRNLFDDKRAASVGSAVAGISGSEYAVNVIEAKHQQNMDDLENNYLYSTIQQKYSYTRAIQDYNKNIQRLSEDFDDSLKDIQASVLQQFQEIDNKIGLTTAQLAQAYGTLQQNVVTAKSAATTKYLEALSKNENTLANALSNTYGLDTKNLTSHTFTNAELGRVYDASKKSYNMNIPQTINSLGNTLASNDGIRIGTYSPGNGYTYNVYATRQDGLQATIGLLQRAYYGMSLQEAAKKWTGKQNPSGAFACIKEAGLGLNEKLSDENLDKFLYAIGRWEGSIKKGETLQDWLNGGNDLSAYATTSAGGLNSTTRDFSGLSAEQIAQVKAFVKDQLGATNAKTDVEMHNAIADMMRKGMDIDEIADTIRYSNKGKTLESDSLKNVKFVADKLITKKGLSSDKAKQEFYDQIQDLVNKGDYDLLLDSLNGSLYDTLSATNKDTLDAAMSLNNYLDEIEQMLQNIYDGGKNTGISVSYWEKAKNLFGQTSDPEYAEMQNYIDAVVQIYRKKITGAAFTEAERKEYQKEFPSLFKDDTYNKSTIESLRKKNDTDIRSAYGSTIGGKQRYDELVNEIEKLKKGETTTKTSSSSSINWLTAAKNIYTMLANLNGSAANSENSALQQDFKDTSVFTNPGVWTGANQSTVNQGGFQSHMPTK